VNKRFASLIFVFVVFAALGLFQASRMGTSLVLTPSQVISGEGHSEPRIRVAGRVADSSIEYKLEPELELRFAVQDPGKAAPAGAAVLPVVYKGLKPDMFAAGRDVIIDGEIQEGTLRARSLLTQCPSKYEPPDPAKMYKKDASSGGSAPGALPASTN
jgi:cytochrome c-type biogenesis protein CcmE